MFLIPVSILLATTYWAYLEENRHSHQLLKQQQQHNLKLLENHYQQELKSVVTDLKFLSEQNELKNLINQKTEARIDLAQEYQSFSQFKGKYDQVRFIDIDGREQIRVNLIQGYAVIIPDDQLQDKSDRYYFTETITLDKEQVYLSAFDLNIDSGKIETPIKPVIRLATPIFNKNNQVSGIVILNFLGQQLLDFLADSPDSPNQHLLINEQGYWLKGLKSSDEWGHMYPDRQSKTILNRFPNAWEQIQAAEKGQFHSASGLFSYTSINPLASITEHKLFLSNKPNPVWKLVSYIPQHVFNAHAAKLRQKFIIFDIVLALFWLVSCTFISRSKLQRNLAYKEIIERDEQLINILSTAFDSIITINDRGIIETFNPAACRMFGYQEHEALGHK
ncbi:MAG: PAS domain S-box protein, partial [Thiotrichaceae bacterium]|nr:PAS domain S-box protein [Thiotrichaceae bacterium]